MANIDDGIIDVDLTDEEGSGLVTKDVDSYKGQKNRTDRIAIIYKRTLIKSEEDLSPKDKEALKTADKAIIVRGEKKYIIAPYVIGAYTHYIAGVGQFLCLSKRKNNKITDKAMCCEKDTARSYFVSPIVQYLTDKDGQPKKPFGYELKAWRYSEDKFKALRKKNAVDDSRRLLAGDIVVTCQEPEFQKLDMDLTTKAIWRANEKVEDQIYAEAVSNIFDPMKKLLGRTVTKDYLQEKLGLAPSDLTAADLADPKAEDFDGLLEAGT